MRRGEIPDEVLRFIERRIDSVPHLEALLLLWENPAQSWAAADIAARVYIGTEQAGKVLADLARNGLIMAAPAAAERHVYNSAWDESQLMEKVAAAYRRHIVHVSGLIHAKAASQAVREFARAFQFKPEE
ncbi:MAG TPA: hypothetical protein VMH77_00220 [Steroidobacteraceae bacterium]|nr:hypothetical protein [Steroidobacteraceae bacterium]